jgi:hypothetical protein
MTYRIYPAIDGQWRFGTRVYQTFIEARRALTQTSRRLRKERRAVDGPGSFQQDQLIAISVQELAVVASIEFRDVPVRTA